MNFFNHSHYRSGKNVTRLIGLWPFQNDWERRICSFFTFIFFTTQVIFQILGLIVYFDDKEIILELISPFIIDIAMAVKYGNIWINIKSMTKLLDEIRQSWTLYTKAEEKRILDEFSHIGQLIIYGYMISVYMTILIFITEPLMPKLINLISNSNETIANRYPVTIYWYIIDMEENFYFTLCYEIICIVTILTITVANDSMFILFLLHACALFAVVGQQLENLPNKDEIEKNCGHNEISNNINGIQYNYYVMCIKNHKRAIEFSNLLENLYVWSFGVVIALNMPIMSITAVQVVSQADTIQKIIKYSMFTLTQVMHLFFDCYLSQRLTDSSIAIQQHVTQSQWYKMHVKTQKLVTLITLRSQVPCKLTAGKLLLLSMETFGTIVKTSVSYFTVMLSMR